MGFDVETRSRNVIAVLGPTNTGKTHLAIERMLGHETGMIGLPLRLLAREVYDRIVSRIGESQVALITGEEKIRPENPRFWVCTVEAMPRDVDVDFLAIDEIQLAADPERGHVFTDRLLHARGKLETLLLGAGTMRDTISDLVPGANFITRPRLSKLSYAGQKKITRLPARTAVVAFSASEVYAIAELIRRQQGGAAVVMGALSPRTRNAQVALYQSGDVDYLVATDAIGMGLNLDVNHVSFAAVRKFDGHNFRPLTPAELAQIAGRAGRHMNDGTFGITGDVEPLDQDMIDRLETHTFDTVKVLQWRARKLDFASIDALAESLREVPREARLIRARTADDLGALEAVMREPEVADLARGPAAVTLLWDVCQVPDYRKISPQNHAELVSTIYKFLRTSDERIPEDWFAKQIELADRTDGDIDTLATRIAHIRTWTFVANRQNWLKDPGHWQGRTREIEDALSDALHEQLTQRFVDKRTSALMKGLRAKEEMSADIGDDGAILVEGHFVGKLKGFRFIPDTQGDSSIHGKAARSAAAQVLAKELGMRVRRVTAAKNDAFKLTRNARIMWRDQEIGRLEPTEDGLKPQITVNADEHLQPADKDKVQERLVQWLTETVAERLAPLVEIAKAEDVTGLAKGIAFRLVENLGSLQREAAAEEIKSLDQTARSQLRKYGARFGAFNIYFPQALKPAAAELALTLWALKHAGAHGLDIEALPDPPRAGLTSVPAKPDIPDAFYRACGYHKCGPRAVRMDMLERLADLIRPLIAWRRPEGQADALPPKGSTGDGAFIVTPELMSILGCSSEEMALVLKALGFRNERRPKRRPAPRPVAPAPTQAVATGETQETATGDAPQVADASVGASPEAAASLSAVSAVPTEAAVAAPATAETAADGLLQSEAVPSEPTAEPPAPSPVADIVSGAAEPTGTPLVTGPAASEPADASADHAAPTVTASVETAAAEVEMEEIWRPRRRHEHGRHGNQRGERGQGRGQQRGSEEGQRDREAGRGHHRHRNRHHGPKGPRQDRPGEQAPAAVAAEGAAIAPDQVAAAAAGDVAIAGAVPGKPADGGRHRHQGGGHQGSGHQGGGHQGGGPGRQNRRDDHRRDEHRRDDRPHHGAGQQHGRGAGPDGGKHRQGGGFNKPAPKRQTVDPDLPFAKLSALKAELEKRAQERSS